MEDGGLVATLSINSTTHSMAYTSSSISMIGEAVETEGATMSGPLKVASEDSVSSDSPSRSQGLDPQLLLGYCATVAIFLVLICDTGHGMESDKETRLKHL
ncbi:hypothetical protein T439DRAFT_329533 [Meredithblackwellia eburnea MCA 4105]